MPASTRKPRKPSESSNSESTPLQPERGVAVETPLETAAECRDVEAAQFATRMRGIDDD